MLNSLDKLAKHSTREKKGFIFWVVVVSFLVIPFITSLISTIHVVDFFAIGTTSATYWLAIYTAVAFEMGLCSALISISIISRIKEVEWVVYFIFILLTIYQCMGNSYYVFDTITQKMKTAPELINSWAELLWLEDLLKENLTLVKRTFAWVAGGVLPIISLAFWHLLAVFVGKVEKERNFNKEEIIEEKPVKKEVVEGTAEEEPIEEVVIEEKPIEEEVVIEEPVEEEIVEEPVREVPVEEIVVNEKIFEEEKEPIIYVENDTKYKYGTKHDVLKEDNDFFEKEDEQIISEEEYDSVDDEVTIEKIEIENAAKEIVEEEIKESTKEKENKIKKNFKDVIENKKKKLQQDKEKFLPLLDILFSEGNSKKGDVLPSYIEFIKLVDKEVYSDDDIKTFLTLCNYLDITSLSDNVRKALMFYDESKITLKDYLSFGIGS